MATTMSRLRTALPWLFLLSLYIAAPTSAHAMKRSYGWCEKGGQAVVTGGVSSTTLVQRSYPACTVTVYLSGTIILATIYSDNGTTPMANPFTSATNGYWYFYAANARYDIQLTGSGLAAPITLGDVLLNDGPYISVTTCGAKGDGTTDDTAAFQTCLNAAATYSTGGIEGAYVFAPAPAVAYLIAGTITVPVVGTSSSIILSGAGTGTQLNCTSNAACIAIPHVFGAGPGFQLRDLTLNGNSGASAVAVHAIDQVGLKISGVTIQHFTGAGSSGLFFENRNFWNERATVISSAIYDCTKAIRFWKDPGDSYDSYAYNRFLDVAINVLDGQTALSIENGMYGYGGVYRFGANVNQSALPTYLITMSGSSTFVENEIHITAETNAGTSYFFNIGAGSTFRGFGEVTGSLGVGVVSGVVATELPRFDGFNKTETITNLGAAGTAPGGLGSWIIPNLGAANNFCSGFGWNVYFDHYGTSPTDKYISQGDGAHNGGALALSCPGNANGAMNYYVFPSTGGTDQQIAYGGLSAYQALAFDSTGATVSRLNVGLLVTNSEVPSYTAGPGAGTGPTISLGGSDNAMSFEIIIGSTPTANQALLNVTYHTPVPNVAYCSIAPANAATVLVVQPWINTQVSPTTGFTVMAPPAGYTAAANLKWYITCIPIQ